MQTLAGAAADANPCPGRREMRVQGRHSAKKRRIFWQCIFSILKKIVTTLERSNVSKERLMLSMVLSTVAFFVAAYYAKRRLAEMGIAKGMTRGLVVFCVAAAVSYAVAFAADSLMS